MSSSDAPPSPISDAQTPGRAEAAPAPTTHLETQDVPWATAAGSAPERNESRDALMAECRALERRWADLYAHLVHLNDEWRQLMEPVAGAPVEGAEQPGRRVGWADGALLFYEIDRHAGRLSSLATEALRTCNQYAAALQRATGALES